MSNETPYFDRLEIRDGYIQAVVEDEGTLTPLRITAIGHSDKYPTEIEIQQTDGPWWYSRKKYGSEAEIEKEIDQIQQLQLRVKQPPPLI